MIAIVCLDNRGGMAFGGRRQSRDSVLCKRIVSLVGDAKFYMSEYSKKLFGDSDNIIADDTFLEKASRGDFCFVELHSLSNYEEKIEKLIIYRWNRDYPFDLKLDINLSTWKRVSQNEFAGSSHDKICEEVYIR